MAALVWDKVGEHKFEIGVDHGILFPVKQGKYQKGVAWNGLTAVTESPEGAEPNDQYADNIKYLTLRSTETFGATIEAFTYPEEFLECDGTLRPTAGVHFGQQPRAQFGFCYRTKVGNDVQGMDAGYLLHLIYGCTVSPSERAYQTVNDSPEAMTFSWELDSTPVQVSGYQPVSSITIDSTVVPVEQMDRIEKVLYGSFNTESRLPMPEEIESILTTPVPYFAVSAPDPEKKVGALNVSDLQTDIAIAEDKKITGNLNYVENYRIPGSGKTVSGHVLVLNYPHDSNNAVVVKQYVLNGGPTSGRVFFTNDTLFVNLFENNASNKTSVLEIKQKDVVPGPDPAGGYVITETYDLKDLTLKPKQD